MTQTSKSALHTKTSKWIKVRGAQEHNLQNLTLQFPKNKLIVITGLSGSGKSSLAFDTLYAEGQYRYAQTFSSYARSFIGELRRPQVDHIENLSPVIAIEQKRGHNNPRSTVGTTTEIYDFLRVLYARTAVAYSLTTHKPLKKQTKNDIFNRLQQDYATCSFSLLAPLVRSRKGHYRELFEQLCKRGYTKAYIDGKLCDIRPGLSLERFQSHDIAVVIDHLQGTTPERLQESLTEALDQGQGVCIVLPEHQKQPIYFSTMLVDPDTGQSYEEPAPNSFSFNTPQGACPDCKGLGFVDKVHLDALIPDKKLSLAQGGIPILGQYKKDVVFSAIKHIFSTYHSSIHQPISQLPDDLLHTLLYGHKVAEQVAPLPYPTLADTIEQKGILGFIQRKHALILHKDRLEAYFYRESCKTCKGFRLKPEALQFKLANKHIGEVANLSLQALEEWLRTLPTHLNHQQKHIAEELLKELIRRVDLLVDLGLGYLTLARGLGTLSGGEAQRTRLATQIGNQLTGVMYILDEPSIGLHSRDNTRLIQALQHLRDLGNTVVVVEHDKETMQASDYMIDMGPGAGKEGGKVIAAGKPEEMHATCSLTAQYLSGKKRVALSKQRGDSQQTLSLIGATGHNLKSIDLHIPLSRLVCVSGVSGSGKSTLIHRTLVPILKQKLYRAHKQPMPYQSIQGVEAVDKVIEIDQSPIGRTPRSNPATYTGVFTDIRLLFSKTAESQLRGYTPGRFSFNVKEGRCEECEGGGIKLLSMDFLPDVHIPCAACLTQRYNPETLEIRYNKLSIADVLNMSVKDARTFFKSYPIIHRKLAVMDEVGLGYVSLGQHATTLSGGEAQRIKLAAELLRKDSGQTLYILDEPTTGLHFEDIAHLIELLQRLVNKGNTVLIIEHSLEVLAAADYIVDLGPEGGEGGGEIVATGTPEEISQVQKSFTGKFLSSALSASTLTSSTSQL